MIFSAEELEKCRSAMDKPAPIEALKLIASGSVIVELTHDKRDLYLDSVNGRRVRDPEFPNRKMLLSGGWPLYRAGMIDDFCVVTDAGRKVLAEYES